MATCTKENKILSKQTPNSIICQMSKAPDVAARSSCRTAVGRFRNQKKGKRALMVGDGQDSWQRASSFHAGRVTASTARLSLPRRPASTEDGVPGLMGSLPAAAFASSTVPSPANGLAAGTMVTSGSLLFPSICGSPLESEKVLSSQFQVYIYFAKRKAMGLSPFMLQKRNG